jgi:hypothetical protein
VIGLSAQTLVTRGATNRTVLAPLRKGMRVMTMEVDGGPAVRVRILPGA